MGCKWYNMAFQNVTAAATVTLAAGNHGAAFIDCDFLGNGTTTKGVISTNNVDFTVEGCRFYGVGDANLKQLIGIEVAGTSTNSNIRIVGNYINAAVGITIVNSAVCSGLIANNFLDVTSLSIDENSDKLMVAYNTWISAATLAGSFDFEVTKGVGNIGTGSNVTGGVPFVTIA
jgi:nitrous oxidase accessory protein NosD